MIELWIDGSAQPNPGTGGWAVTGRDGDVIVNLSGGATGTTNNRMEMIALREALRYIGARPATVYMDSEYVRNGVLEWAKKWKSRGWRKGNKETPNRDLWEELLLLYNPNVQLFYVRSSENRAHTYAEIAREEA